MESYKMFNYNQSGRSHYVQCVKDPAFPQLWLGFIPWPENFCMPGCDQKKVGGKKKKVIKDNKTKKVKNVDIKTTISLITLDEHGLSKAIQGQRSSE